MTVLHFLLALSPIGFAVGISGLATLAVVFLGVAVLPDTLKKPLMGAGLLALAIGAAYSVADGRAVHRTQLAQAREATEAEHKRAEAAEAVTRADLAQAAQDTAALAALDSKIKDLTNELAKRPGSDALCLDRDLSRRLRGL